VKFRAHPALLIVLVGVCAISGCHGSGGGHKGRARARALKCRLQVSARRGTRAVVSYDDETGDSKMSAAISSEVSAWNASAAPVVLVPSKTNPAITFRAVSGKTTVSACSSSSPRVVTVQLSTPKWDAAVGAKGSIKDPTGAIARELGRALGLASGGTCPQLTSPNTCPHRAQVPGRGETKVLEKLYASATPSAAATP
jgi:hypothetical protein